MVVISCRPIEGVKAGGARTKAAEAKATARAEAKEAKEAKEAAAKAAKAEAKAAKTAQQAVAKKAKAKARNKQAEHPPQLCQRSSGMQTAACIGRVRNALRRSWANQVLRMAIGLRPQGATGIQRASR